MNFGDAQSVLQISVALNAAYFSFREIRMPSASRFAQTLERTLLDLASARSMLAMVDKPSEMRPGDAWTSVYIKKDVAAGVLDMHERNAESLRDPYRENLERFDRIIRLVALAMAAIGLVLLMISAANSKVELSVRMFVFGSAFLFAPTLFAIFYNWTMSGLQERTLRDLEEIRAGIQQVKADFARDQLPRYHAAVEASGAGASP